MKYDMVRPCENCPFLKEGGVRLTKERIRQIVHAVTDTQGASFACHKTVHRSSGSDDDEVTTCSGHEGAHCAGALIFAEKYGNVSQIVRWMERIGVYDRRRLDKAAFPLVFDSLAQMLRTAIR